MLIIKSSYSLPIGAFDGMCLIENDVGPGGFVDELCILKYDLIAGYYNMKWGLWSS